MVQAVVLGWEAPKTALAHQGGKERRSDDSPVLGKANTPARLARPPVGFNPVTPFIVDGKRIDPRVSVPREP